MTMTLMTMTARMMMTTTMTMMTMGERRGMWAAGEGCSAGTRPVYAPMGGLYTPRSVLMRLCQPLFSLVRFLVRGTVRLANGESGERASPLTAALCSRYNNSPPLATVSDDDE